MRKEHFFPSRWIAAADIDGADVLTSITKAGGEDVGQPPEEKCVVHFQPPLKPLICNATNYDRIAAIAGSDDTDRWPGTKVVLYTELATFRGKSAPAVRIKPPPGGGVAAAPVSAPPTSTASELPSTSAKSGKVVKTTTLEDDEIPF